MRECYISLTATLASVSPEGLARIGRHVRAVTLWFVRSTYVSPSLKKTYVSPGILFHYLLFFLCFLFSFIGFLLFLF